MVWLIKAGDTEMLDRKAGGLYKQAHRILLKLGARQFWLLQGGHGQCMGETATLLQLKIVFSQLLLNGLNPILILLQNLPVFCKYKAGLPEWNCRQ
jgi:hypothetical protein